MHIKKVKQIKFTHSIESIDNIDESKDRNESSNKEQFYYNLKGLILVFKLNLKERINSGMYDDSIDFSIITINLGVGYNNLSIPLLCIKQFSKFLNEKELISYLNEFETNEVLAITITKFIISILKMEYHNKSSDGIKKCIDINKQINKCEDIIDFTFNNGLKCEGCGDNREKNAMEFLSELYIL